MKRYIEESEVIKGIRNNLDAGDYIYWFGGDVEDEVANFPSADVVEVKHGEWISLHNGYYKCSCCGSYWKLVGTPELNGMYYCLNCGAKMQLDEEDIL